MNRRPILSETQRKHSAATSEAMKRVAEARRCPKCKRGFALKRVKDSRGVNIGSVCRWGGCGYERISAP